MELPNVTREDEGGRPEETGKPSGEDSKAKKTGLEVDGPSISLRTFADFTTSLADKFRDVNLRLIAAFGIDTSNEGVRIEWDQFLSLKCFLELFTLGSDELETIWLKALDPRGLALVPLEQFQTFLERIARGSMSDQPTAVSTAFSSSMMELMHAEGLFSVSGTSIDIRKLAKALRENVIDVELFNQLLKQDCLFEVKSANQNYDNLSTISKN